MRADRGGGRLDRGAPVLGPDPGVRLDPLELGDQPLVGRRRGDHLTDRALRGRARSRSGERRLPRSSSLAPRRPSSSATVKTSSSPARAGARRAPRRELDQDRDGRLVVGAEDRLAAAAIDAVGELDLDPARPRAPCRDGRRTRPSPRRCPGSGRSGCRRRRAPGRRRRPRPPRRRAPAARRARRRRPRARRRSGSASRRGGRSGRASAGRSFRCLALHRSEGYALASGPGATRPGPRGRRRRGTALSTASRSSIRSWTSGAGRRPVPAPRASRTRRRSARRARGSSASARPGPCSPTRSGPPRFRSRRSPRR